MAKVKNNFQIKKYLQKKTAAIHKKIRRPTNKINVVFSFLLSHQHQYRCHYSVNVKPH